MANRTSFTHPLKIASLAAPGGGRIGVTFCPGKHDPAAMTGAWIRELETDLAAIEDWGCGALVTLVEAHELATLGVEALGSRAQARGLRWRHLPIVDGGVPTSQFEAAWREVGPALHALLDAGEGVVVHCRGGLGRAGTIAARLLIERGLEPEDAMRRVRLARPGAIETAAQERYLRRCGRIGSAAAAATERGRGLGCLLGLAVGDAIGTTLEFKARDSVPPVTGMVGGGPFGLRPGEWTDDTSMALCLADSLLARRRLDSRDLMLRFQRWRRDGHNSVNGRCFDIGIATAAAISRFERTGDPLAGDSDPRTAGNGSIMRLAPVALAYRSDAGAAKASARLQSRVTHRAKEAVDACDLLVQVLLAGMSGADKSAALAPAANKQWAPSIRQLASGSWRGKERGSIKSSGYVVHTLEAALWAVDQAETFAEAVLLAANLGDDADTVAAVAGQVAGAVHGAQSIPSAWLEQLAWRNYIVERGEALLDLELRRDA